MPTLQEIEAALRKADAAGDTAAATEIAAMYQQALQAQASAPPPGPGAAPAPAPATTIAAPPPTAPPAPPGAAPGPPGAAPAPGGFDRAAYMRQQQQEMDLSRRADMAMNPGRTFFEGMGQSVASTGRGVRQIWNKATGDDQELARLEADEMEARRLDAPLLKSGAGRTGQVVGHIAQAAIPGGMALKIPKVAQMGVKGAIAVESALGAVTGGIQPIGDGSDVPGAPRYESRAKNAAAGAVVGALAPGFGKALKGGAALASAAMNPKAAIIRMGQNMMKSGESVAGPAAEAARRYAGNKIAAITGPMKIEAKDLAPKLRTVINDYRDVLPEPIYDRFVRAATAPSTTSHKGTYVQKLREMIGAELADRNTTGSTKVALQEARRALDSAVLQVLPKDKARALRAAQEAYRTGRGPSGKVDEVVGPYVRPSAAVRGAYEGSKK